MEQSLIAYELLMVVDKIRKVLYSSVGHHCAFSPFEKLCCVELRTNIAVNLLDLDHIFTTNPSQTAGVPQSSRRLYVKRTCFPWTGLTRFTVSWLVDCPRSFLKPPVRDCRKVFSRRALKLTIISRVVPTGCRVTN